MTSKLDIVSPDQRGVATGFNEFAGYGGVALAGLITGYLASAFDPRWTLFVFGLTVILLALGSALLFSRETIHWARAESAAHKAGTLEAGFWFTAVAMVLSGSWVALAMEETHARINPASEPGL